MITSQVDNLNESLAGMHDLLYTLAAADAVVDKSAKTGPLDLLADALESTLKFYQGNLDDLHVPYSFGWSIVLLTLTVKLVTFPLVKQQVESQLAVQNIKPRLDAIKKRYEGDDDRIKKETELLYEKANVNPLAGCLPTLATIPIFIGLYRSLSNAAAEGIFNGQGFYWIPSLEGPTTIAARQAGTATAWLFPLVDGAPPIGWDEASHYLLLPVLLVVAQFASAKILKPPVNPEDEEKQNATMKILQFLPLMIGWFSLNVPSGLSLYYFSNTILTMAQQVFLRKLGGADVEEVDLGPIKKLGSARRTGEALSPKMVEQVLAPPAVLAASGEGAAALADGHSAPGAEPEEEDYQPTILQTRSKRRRKVPVKLVEADAPASGEADVVKVSASALDDEFPAMM